MKLLRLLSEIKHAKERQAFVLRDNVCFTFFIILAKISSNFDIVNRFYCRRNLNVVRRCTNTGNTEIFRSRLYKKSTETNC